MISISFSFCTILTKMPTMCILTIKGKSEFPFYVTESSDVYACLVEFWAIHFLGSFVYLEFLSTCFDKQQFKIF